MIPVLPPTVRNVLIAALIAILFIVFGPPAVTAVCTQLTGDPFCGLRLGPECVGMTPEECELATGTPT
jgi:hypothetical protein